MDEQLAAFEGKKVRRVWDEKVEEWLFSVIDVVGALTESVDPSAYWRKLKERLRDEGSETVTRCHGLKMVAADGKMRETDVADTETCFRIIQSIPSPKAEPFKLWLARVGYERVEEEADPELTINRAMNTYLRKGYTPEWVNLRLKSIEIRKDLTDEWQKRRVKAGKEFAILTDDITQAWAGMTTKKYKRHKSLKKENLRDNMTNLELVLNMLAETSTVEISKVKQPDTFHQNRQAAREGGEISGGARKQLEKVTGKSVISKDNYLTTPQRVKRLK